MKCQWERTQIPTLFLTNPKKAERLITSTIEEAKTLLKIPSDRRDENFASEMNTLLDMAACHHQNRESCCCSSKSRVPAAWKPFLLNQRGSRVMTEKLTNLSLSLRTANKIQLSPEEVKAVESERKTEQRKAMEAQHVKRENERVLRE